jgi:hypothetical protein
MSPSNRQREKEARSNRPPITILGVETQFTTDEPSQHSPLADDAEKSRYSATIEAAMPNIRDLSDPEFAPIKARLARAYLEHKDELGVLLTDDAEIIALVDEITALLLAAWVRASLADNQRWKERYRWFSEAVAELQDTLPGKPLDG